MKNLGKTIDRILKIDPDLEGKLVPIRNKWERYPAKTKNYWKELLDFLNSDPLNYHPRREEIRNILISKRKEKKQTYSFQAVTSSDEVLGAIPENVSDLIKRHDRQSIEVAKLRVEATMTYNQELLSEVVRKEVLLDINTKKIWVSLKDYFKLWNKTNSYNIKSKDGLLVLVEQQQQNAPSFIGPGIVKMDANTLKQFLQYLGYDQMPDQSEEPDAGPFQ